MTRDEAFAALACLTDAEIEEIIGAKQPAQADAVNTRSNTGNNPVDRLMDVLRRICNTR